MRNVLTGDDTNENLFGSARADLIDALGGNDSVFANAGNDLIFGGIGDDQLHAEDGNDRAYGGTGNDFLDGGYGADSLYGGQGSDGLTGLQGNDWLYGGGGNDYLVSGNSSENSREKMFGGNGDDTMFFDVRNGGTADGGNGNDAVTLFWYDNIGPLDPIMLDMVGPNPSATFGSTTLNFFSIEQVKLHCYTADDTARGGDGDDELNMHLGANIAHGNGGDDLIQYYVGAANVLDGGDGLDTLSVGQYSGGPLIFSVIGTTGSDGHGSTLINFENFRVGGAYFADTVTLGDGDDWFNGGFGNDVGYGGDGRDRLNGASDNDSLYGGTGRDVLIGAIGDDLLSGGNGDDRLIGGVGVDLLTGGIGSDEFRFRLPDQYPDVITDFQSGVDRISFFGSAYDASLLPGPLDPSQFAVGAAVGTHAQFFVVFNPTDNTTSLFWDRNGDGFGSLLQIALLEGTTTFTIDDIGVF